MKTLKELAEFNNFLEEEYYTKIVGSLKSRYWNYYKLDAEGFVDVVQEVAIKCFEKYSSLDDKNKIGSYAYTTLKFKLIDAWNNNKKYNDMEKLVIDDEEWGSESYPVEVEADSKVKDAVACVLEKNQELQLEGIELSLDYQADLFIALTTKGISIKKANSLLKVSERKLKEFKKNLKEFLVDNKEQFNSLLSI